MTTVILTIVSSFWLAQSPLHEWSCKGAPMWRRLCVPHRWPRFAIHSSATWMSSDQKLAQTQTLKKQQRKQDSKWIANITMIICIWMEFEKVYTYYVWNCLLGMDRRDEHHLLKATAAKWFRNIHMAQLHSAGQSEWNTPREGQNWIYMRWYSNKYGTNQGQLAFVYTCSTQTTSLMILQY